MSRFNRLRPLAGLLAMGIAAPVYAAPSQPFPTYTTGLQPNGSYVVSNGQIITPAGTQVRLGQQVRAKAVAINPAPGAHTAAVLTLGATFPVMVFDTLSGEVLQEFAPDLVSNGSFGGIAYAADGRTLIFSQDASDVAVASVDPQGLLSNAKLISVPPNTSFIKCFPNSPLGVYDRPCATLYTPYTSYPGGVAINRPGTSAYALLNQNNTLAFFDLTKNPPVMGNQIRVGNAPHSIVVNGEIAYISNEGGRPAVASDFTVLSSGTPIVADPVNGSAVTGTVSVVNLNNQHVALNIPVGLHPTGMALFGTQLLVANTYSDSISVIDTTKNVVTRTISLGLPLAIPGQTKPIYGAGPVGIAVDSANSVAYVTLYDAGAVAVLDLSPGATKTLLGMIPVAYSPSSVAFDSVHKLLVVANDKGIGTLGSFETDHGVTGYNTHQDTGTVSIVPVPDATTLAAMTKQVYYNNHWDLKVNIASAAGGSYTTAPVAIPAKIGDPSLIKHVFLIIKENRTYDQILGDVPAGNGDPSLAVFGVNSLFTVNGKPVADTPNYHAIVQRFPLLDNFYDPSRQSADGHQYITEGMAPYADDIQAPDWVRSYPGGNAGDSLAYLPKGFLFQESVAAGLSTKLYGEYSEQEFWAPRGNGPNGQPLPNQPSWSELYADSQAFEAGTETTLKYQTSQTAQSSVPAVQSHLIKNFPMFDLNIPDQWRVDIWVQDFNNDVTNGTVPSLSILWIMDDHTGGPPDVNAEEADNDLAVGRIIDYISHSSVWPSSAIFIEEDDAQNGVDHIDGHRSTAYIVSPYAVQNGPTDHTYYTQMNMTRTIEQILGLQPLTQFDLLASPMTTDFTNTPNLAPFNHVPAQLALDYGVAPSAAASSIEAAWKAAKVKMFAGKASRADSEDSDVLNHLDWYEATHFTKPYPGESKLRWPSDFAGHIAAPSSIDRD